MREPTTNRIYERRRKSLRTGDCLAVRGVDKFAKLIRLGTWSEFSHIAIVLRLYIPLIDYGENRLWIIESTISSKLKDAMSGKIQCGIQMHLLSQWLEARAAEENEVYLYKLKKPLSAREEENVTEWLLQTNAKEIPYDYAGAYQSWDDVTPWGSAKEDLRKLFCSELYVAALKQAPRLLDLNASEQHPRNVVNLPIFRQKVRLV